jgi:hypothetical protein
MFPAKTWGRKGGAELRRILDANSAIRGDFARERRVPEAAHCLLEKKKPLPADRKGFLLSP